jgi:hypothetical protein
MKENPGITTHQRVRNTAIKMGSQTETNRKVTNEGGASHLSERTDPLDATNEREPNFQKASMRKDPHVKSNQKI